MQHFNLSTPICLLLALALSIAPERIFAEKRVVGWVEKVKLLPGKLTIHAKLDTGAESASLHASDVEDFEKDGRTWVRFKVRNRYGETATIEKELVRTAFIKRHSGKDQKRAVIRMGICLADTFMEADVNLVDRAHFDYQMLIGRNFLAGNVLLDPSRTYTSEPSCKED